MIDRAAIAREAMRSALQVRRNLAIAREQPINPFEVAAALGIDVWFTDTPSLEGMYSRADDARIFLPGLHHRPLGRVCFSCAHELGHSQLGHGNRVDLYIETGARRTDADEIAADVFASSLLMPRPAVLAAFNNRRLDPADTNGLALLTIAFELNVGLDTLIKHLHWGLDAIDTPTLGRLAKLSPKIVRQKHMGVPDTVGVAVPIDEEWRSTAIDLEVGHALALPLGFLGARSLSPQFAPAMKSKSHDIFVAKRPGILPLDQSKLRVELRVAKAGFLGQWRYRYLDDSEAE